MLAACPVTVVVGDPVDTGSADSGDTGGWTDTADSGEPAWVTDFSAYAGHRRFVVDEPWLQCDDEISDVGTEVTGGDLYGYLADVCPNCNHFYENNPTPTSLCDGYLLIGTAYRGVEFREDGTADAEFILGYNTTYTLSTEDPRASWDGENLAFAYELDLSGVTYQVSGEMGFSRSQAEDGTGTD